jgi:phosphatidate cytidylyltransferase
MSQYQYILLTVFGVLFFATAANFTLSLVKPKNETFKKVKVIIKSWWFITTPFVVALGWQKWGILILFYILSVFILFEYFKISKVKYKRYGLISLLILSSLHYLTIAFNAYYLFLILIPLSCLWLVPGLVIFRATISDLELVFSVFFGNAFIIYYLSHIPALVAMPENAGLSNEQASLGLVVLLFLTWGNDVFQFITGKGFGKTKIIPDVSPNKTIGGFIGGMICTTVIAFFTLGPILKLENKVAIIFGFVLSITGMFGDLFFSAVKRNIGVKDFSDLLPGHGGLLDRCDSLIFTAPIFFHFLSLLKQGFI